VTAAKIVIEYFKKAVQKNTIREVEKCQKKEKKKTIKEKRKFLNFRLGPGARKYKATKEFFLMWK
jgi:hypothetical protein